MDKETASLIDLASSGDETALTKLLEPYRDRLRRMVSLRMDGRVRGRFDPSDVIQDAFIEVARRISDYGADVNGPFFLWVRMVTGDRLAQLHRMHLGAEKRNAARDIGLGNSMFPGASSIGLASRLAGQFTSADRGLKREEVRVKLENALNSMDENDREVIAMRHFEELTTDEISTILGLTRSGVLKRYTRAIRRLADTINSTSDISLS